MDTLPLLWSIDVTDIGENRRCAASGGYDRDAEGVSGRFDSQADGAAVRAFWFAGIGFRGFRYWASPPPSNC